MRSTFKILFYIKRNALKSNGKAPVMARITLNGEISQFSLKCEVNPSEWNSQAGKAIGKSASSQQLNGLLDNFRASITQHYREISDREATVSAEKVRNAFLGLQTRNNSLLEVFDSHIKNLKIQNRGNGNNASYQKYVRTRSRLGEFMKSQYKISDINLKEINYSFLCDFEVYLKSFHNCGQNTTAKFLQRLKTIILIAKNNGWIYADPYSNYHIQIEKTERAFLTDKELECIMQKSFSLKRIEQVRDIFVFSCFTGLAYIDVFNLRENNICTTFDESLWIIGKRVKTGVTYRVPLLDIPQKILKKYKGTLPDTRLLPILSNQKMNSYLKEIADICGITKTLSFHVARHTFATTVTLSKGVSIESVSKMLGHTNIKTTQIYARITDTKIGDDMQMLAGKLNFAVDF